MGENRQPIRDVELRHQAHQLGQAEPQELEHRGDRQGGRLVEFVGDCLLELGWPSIEAIGVGIQKLASEVHGAFG